MCRYDPSGIGDSDGSLETVEFSDWVENAATVLERLGSSDNVVVGSSMGGWISLLLASQGYQWLYIHERVAFGDMSGHFASFFIRIRSFWDLRVMKVKP